MRHSGWLVSKSFLPEEIPFHQCLRVYLKRALTKLSHGQHSQLCGVYIKLHASPASVCVTLWTWMIAVLFVDTDGVYAGIFLEIQNWRSVRNYCGPFPSPSSSPPTTLPPVSVSFLLSISSPFSLPFLSHSLAGSGGAPPAGSGPSPSWNRIWCILALKSDMWWQQFQLFSWESTEQNDAQKWRNQFFRNNQTNRPQIMSTKHWHNLLWL